MFSTIVVGTDGSPIAEAAVRRAGELAAAGSAHVHVVAAYRPFTQAELADFRHQLPKEYWDVLDTGPGVSGIVTSASRILKELDVAFDVHEVADNAVDAIFGVSKSVDADLIVVGSRGLGPIRQALLGSVSTRIAHHTPVSLLIVHP